MLFFLLRCGHLHCGRDRRIRTTTCCPDSTAHHETGNLVDSALATGQKVLFEGAQGALLDVLHGTVPYVTSSHTIGAAACTGTGIGLTASTKYRNCEGVCDTCWRRTTPTLIGGAQEEKLRELGGEYGATTGRPRRCGWLDLPHHNMPYELAVSPS